MAENLFVLSDFFQIKEAYQNTDDLFKTALYSIKISQFHCHLLRAYSFIHIYITWKERNLHIYITFNYTTE